MSVCLYINSVYQHVQSDFFKKITFDTKAGKNSIYGRSLMSFGILFWGNSRRAQNCVTRIIQWLYAEILSIFTLSGQCICSLTGDCNE